MKDTKLGMWVLLAQLIYSFAIVSAQVPVVNRTHGQVCGPYDHCLINAALICTDGRCACSSGRVSDKFAYDLEWVAAASRCSSKLDSVCIGTAEATPANEIPCLGGNRCEQVEGLPLGVGVCKAPLEPLQLHGQPCSELIHCDVAAGLICSLDSKICSCGTGPLTETYNYDLRWDSDRAQCVGNVGSACIGTRDTDPTPVAKRIECVVDNGCVHVGHSARHDCTAATVYCEQIEGLPMGIGYCKENIDDTGNPTTTPASASSTKVSAVFVALTAFVLMLSTIQK